MLEGKSVALRVPSVMLPRGKAWNLILNPRHAGFSALRVSEVVPLSIDPRNLK